MASLGDISVRLTADVASFKSGMKGAAQAAAAVTAAIAAAVAGAVNLTRAMADAGDAAAKAGKRVGLSAEAMQELGFAAALTGASMGDVEKALARQAANANDAANGIGEARDAYERLGVSVVDSTGALKSQDQLLTETVGAISKLTSETEKVALAQDIFGRAGKKLLPMLNQGAKGMGAMRQEARDLGLVLSNETAAASEKFNDDVARLEASVTGLRNELGTALLPVLDSVVTEMIDIAQEFRGTGKASEVVTQSVTGLADAVQTLAPLLTVVTTTTGVLIDGFKTLDITANLLAIGIGGLVEGFLMYQAEVMHSDKAGRQLEGHQKRLAKLTQETREKIDGWGDATLTGVDAGDRLTESLRRIAQAAKDGTKEMDDMREAQEDLLRPMDSLELAINGYSDAADSASSPTKALKNDTRDLAAELEKVASAASAASSAIGAASSAASGGVIPLDRARAENRAERDVRSGFGAALGEAETQKQLARPGTVASGPNTGAISKGAAGQLTSQSQALSGAFAAVTGGIGALVPVLAGAVTQTEGFQRVMAAVDDIFGPIIEGTFGAALESVAGFLEPVAKGFETLAPAINTVISVMNPLIGALKLFGGPLAALGKGIGKLARKIADSKLGRAFQKGGEKIKDFFDKLGKGSKAVDIYTANHWMATADLLEIAGHVAEAARIRGKAVEMAIEADEAASDASDDFTAAVAAATSAVDVWTNKTTSSAFQQGVDPLKRSMRGDLIRREFDDVMGAVTGSLSFLGDASKSAGDALNDVASSSTNVPEIFRRAVSANQASQGGGGPSATQAAAAGALTNPQQQFTVGAYFEHASFFGDSSAEEQAARRQFVNTGGRPLGQPGMLEPV